jgi:hypothetical protein
MDAQVWQWVGHVVILILICPPKTDLEIIVYDKRVAIL